MGGIILCFLMFPISIFQDDVLLKAFRILSDRVGAQFRFSCKFFSKCKVGKKVERL